MTDALPISSTSNDALVVITTTENFTDAERLARELVARELAACVQIIPSMTAIYRWQGKLEQANEALLLIKTTRGNYDALAAAIQSLHSYETPEIIALPATEIAADYLAWLRASVKSSPLNDPQTSPASSSD